MNKGLTVIKDSSLYLPNEDELREAIADLDGLIRPSTFGQISIAPAGAGTFNIREAGADEPTPGYREVFGVIMASTATNICWGNDFANREEGEQPMCRSFDGVTGIERDSGECHSCADCPRNQFDPDTGRKACANQRRLYIMRPGNEENPGDLVPVIMTLPPSALKAFNDYRIYCRLTERVPMWALVTKITLQQKKSKNGKSTYSCPVFTPEARLDQAQAKKIEAMVVSIMAAAQRSGMMTDEEAGVPMQAAPAVAPDGFTVVSTPDDLPEGF